MTMAPQVMPMLSSWDPLTSSPKATTKHPEYKSKHTNKTTHTYLVSKPIWHFFNTVETAMNQIKDTTSPYPPISP